MSSKKVKAGQPCYVFDGKKMFKTVITHAGTKYVKAERAGNHWTEFDANSVPIREINNPGHRKDLLLFLSEDEYHDYLVKTTYIQGIMYVLSNETVLTDSVKVFNKMSLTDLQAIFEIIKKY